jgi:hypothetical protein
MDAGGPERSGTALSPRRLRPAVALLGLGCGALLVACGGGGGGGGSGGTPPPSGPNVVAMVVDAGPAGTINTPFVSVTVCAPGGGSCQTVDSVLVDTASSGLRILGSALAPLQLPQASDANGDPLVECIQFADGYSWGPVVSADVKIGGEQASGIPIQVIGDSAYPSSTVPASCSSGAGALANSVVSFGANGLLGVSVFREDCGSGCALATPPTGWYYGCPAAGTGCTPVSVATAAQLQNPVAHFAADNNGVIVQLPSVDPAGAVAVSGYLLFGIGTQGNNALNAATILRSDVFGNFTTQFENQTLNASFVDSGSNALFFPSTLPQCTSTAAAGYYCPMTVQSLSAMNSSNGIVSNVSFKVASAEGLVKNATFSAFGTLAGTNPLGASFDWGLPFFYGRTIYVAIEQQTTAAGAGPFVAY